MSDLLSVCAAGFSCLLSDKRRLPWDLISRYRLNAISPVDQSSCADFWRRRRDAPICWLSSVITDTCSNLLLRRDIHLCGTFVQRKSDVLFSRAILHRSSLAWLDNKIETSGSMRSLAHQEQNERHVEDRHVNFQTHSTIWKASPRSGFESWQLGHLKTTARATGTEGISGPRYSWLLAILLITWFVDGPSLLVVVEINYCILICGPACIENVSIFVRHMRLGGVHQGSTI